MRMPTGFRAYPLDTTGWVELVPMEEKTVMDTNACTPLTEQLAENAQAIRNEASWPKIRVNRRADHGPVCPVCSVCGEPMPALAGFKGKPRHTTCESGRKGGEASTPSTTADGSTAIDTERLALCEVFSIDKRTGARQPFSVFEGNLAHLAREIDRAVDELGADTWVSAERLWLDS